MRLRKLLATANGSTSIPGSYSHRHALPLLACFSLLFFIVNHRIYAPILSTPRFSIFHRKNNNSTFPSANRSTPTIHLISTSYGGLGNQLYFLCEALVLAYNSNLTLIPPPIVARGRSPDASFARYFRLDVLQQIVPVLEKMPSNCDQKLSALYFVRRRGEPPASDTPLTSRAAVAACRSAGGRGDWLACGTAVAENANRYNRLLPLTRDPFEAMEFSNEIAERRDNNCIMVDGHSYQRKGLLGDEYLYSFLRYVESVQRIKDRAMEMDPENLLVVHLRWDEKECVRWPQAGKVCLRINRSVARKDTVEWVTVEEFVDMILEKMLSSEVKRAYFAVSPYADDNVVDEIREGLEEKITILPQIELERNDEHEMNMIERELAIRAKVFIADYMSTWSSTVYYKRRTLGKDTEFSKVLIGKDPDLGFFEKSGLLREPQWFHQQGLMEDPVALSTDAM